jgi:hypothetical protein
MHTGALIAFKISHTNSHPSINRFCREFYGYTDKSNKGKYSYERAGFISKFRHINLLRGLIIVRLEDSEEIMAFLRKYNASVFMREIILLHSDVQKLNEKIPANVPGDEAESDVF